jgi:cbb3-type cytochrome oxidase maturation protein
VVWKVLFAEFGVSVLYIVLPLAIVIVAAAVLAFVWSARSGQMDDLETPAVRMLHDDTE